MNRRLFSFIVIALLLSGAYLIHTKLPHKSNRIYTALDHSDIPTGFNGYGIDISHYQGAINWDMVKDSLGNKIGFVYFKVSEGANISDKTWKQNNDALDRIGILNGGYHFFVPTVDAEKQADNFLRNYPGEQRDLPPVLDVETETANKSTLIASVRAWLKKVEEKTGRQPIIYTSYNMYSNILKDAFKGYYFWVANYNRREDRFTDPNILFWQFSDQGILPGIENFVDLNYSRINYLEN